jgi:hypothetical protein
MTEGFGAVPCQGASDREHAASSRSEARIQRRGTGAAPVEKNERLAPPLIAVARASAITVSVANPPKSRGKYRLASVATKVCIFGRKLLHLAWSRR